MEIFSEEDIVGIDADHPWADQFEVLSFADGSVSCIPHHLFHDELDEDAPIGNLHIGRCAIIGAGSRVRYGSESQSLHIGRFVTIGNRLRALLHSRCETRTLSTFSFSLIGQGLQNVSPPLAGDVFIKNDVWIGDDVTLMGGCVIENGCVVETGTLMPAGFRTVPYGIYGGNPARLVRFRFSEPLRKALIALAWWDKPLEWIARNMDFFMLDLEQEQAAVPIVQWLASAESDK